MIPIPGFPDYFVDGSEIISAKRAQQKVLSPYENGGFVYVQMMREGKKVSVLLHRLIAQAHLEDFSEDEIVRHRDGNRTNNDPKNLYMSTLAELASETAKGVTYLKRKNKWIAQSSHKGVTIGLGSYNTEKEAIAAYDAYKKTKEIPRKAPKEEVLLKISELVQSLKLEDMSELRAITHHKVFLKP